MIIVKWLIPFKMRLTKNEFFKLTLISFLNGSDIILLFEQTFQSSIQSDRAFLIVLTGIYLYYIYFHDKFNQKYQCFTSKSLFV